MTEWSDNVTWAKQAKPLKQERPKARSALLLSTLYRGSCFRSCLAADSILLPSQFPILRAMILRPIQGISGLYYYEAFLRPTQQTIILPQVQSLLDKITFASGASPPQATSVPQPTRSKHHNLIDKERSFVRVQVPDSSMNVDDTHRLLNVETFKDYGSRGHSLTYFRGNANLPRFGLHGT